MKKLPSNQIISCLNQLIEKVDSDYTKKIDNPKTSLKSVDSIEKQAIRDTNAIQRTIQLIKVYN